MDRFANRAFVLRCGGRLLSIVDRTSVTPLRLRRSYAEAARQQMVPDPIA